MSTWRLYTYDLWGNAVDGWEVNDIYPKQPVELPADPSDSDITDALAASCECDCSDIETDHADADIIYLESNLGKPLGELRREVP